MDREARVAPALRAEHVLYLARDDLHERQDRAHQEHHHVARRLDRLVVRLLELAHAEVLEDLRALDENVVQRRPKRGIEDQALAPLVSLQHPL